MLVYNFLNKFVTAAFQEAADKLNLFIGLNSCPASAPKTHPV